MFRTVEMCKVGYGQMRRQVTEMVKKILDKGWLTNPLQGQPPMQEKIGGMHLFLETSLRG